ncbi:unnamed protein product [Parnassius mnemosyne]|uniref:FLYWCH-type domain-containing protein n=1 Tax=Parnassius mnemosyne TaxID=213953 RepID=A0AAV1L8S0_9NEOP
MSEINVMKRRRGRVLMLNGYQYYKLKVYKDASVIWRCAQYKKNKCTGSVTIRDKKEVKATPNIITCAQDFAKNEIDLKFYECKKKISEDSISVTRVYKNAVSSLENAGNNFINKLPKFGDVKSTLYRYRNELGVEKLYHKTYADVEVPFKFDSFLLADYFRDDGARILVFKSRHARKTMAEKQQYLSDGTFEITPLPFLQLYTIHCDLDSSQQTTNIIPVIYAFLPDKRTETYVTLLQLIKSQITNWEPT